MIKSKFKVGDRVRISKSSKFYGQKEHNPKDVNGTVKTYKTASHSNSYEFTTYVDWDNGTENSYRDCDLELVTVKANNEIGLTVDRDFVMQAYESACSDWKKKIEQKFPELFPKEKYAKLVYDERNIDDTRLYVKDNDGNFVATNYGLSLVNGIAGRYGIPNEAKYRGIYLNKDSSFDTVIKETAGGVAILFKEKN